MIKKFTGFICLILIFKVFSIEDRGENLNKSSLRAAAFIPSNSKFQQIYGNVGTSLQAEEARTWRDHRNLEVWGNAEWIFMDGKPRQRCGTTDINILNISFGFKAIGNVYRDSIFLYAGIGPDIGIVFIENKMNCCSGCGIKYKENVCKAGIGGIIKTGCQVLFTSYLYLDLFVDYLYLPVHFNSVIDVGGCKAGGGLGARF